MRKMKKSHIYIWCMVLGGLLLGNGLMAQDTKSMPDLQTAEPDFFDPTRKEAAEEYKFGTEWRIETGFVQWQQRQNDSISMYLHGLRFGGTVDFLLPYHFSIQTGALASLTYGYQNQHWRSMTAESAQIEVLRHDIVQLELTIPVRAYYTITLWKQLRLFFYAGPQLQIGLTSYDLMTNNTSAPTTEWLQAQGIPLTNHDRYADKQLYRTNIQFGLGGGLEWDRYRLQSGYDFGLNNLMRTPVVPTQKLNEWGWMVTFVYRL